MTRVRTAIEDKYLILRLITDNDFYDSENCVYCVLLFDFDLQNGRKTETCQGILIV